VIQSETGDLALVEASPDKYRLVTSFHAIDGIKSWNNPAMSGGLIVLRNNLEMACYDLRPIAAPAAP
jgi:outer membrane protein assembly factor BamB